MLTSGSARLERWGLIGAAIAFLAVLVLAGPLFVCMPLWVDCYLFDICARALGRGEVVYRDFFLHGPPGMMLTVAGVRYLVGYRSEALRLVDLAIVSAVIVLWVRFSLPARASTAARAWTGIAMFLVYVGMTEWCHCQVDAWMLLPAVAAFAMRLGQVDALRQGNRPRILGMAILEGLFWAWALLMKPFVFIPALGAWLAGLWCLDNSRWTKGVLMDMMGLLIGAVCVFGSVTMWLVFSSNWPWFWEASFSTWNRDYYATSASLMQRLGDITRVLGYRRLLGVEIGWGIVEWLAVGVSLWMLLGPRRGLDPIVAAFYLGWFVEGNFLQRQAPYQVLPAVLLGIGLLAQYSWMRWIMIATVLTWTVLYHPLLNPHRLEFWSRSWREGSSPAIRNALTIDPKNFVAPDWVHLAAMAGDLRSRGVKDRELTCYALSATSLYWTLDVKPSTRYIELYATLVQFPGHETEIRNELFASPERYVVNDLEQRQIRLDRKLWGGFPFDLPEIHRQGRYVLQDATSLAENPRMN
jgi:hypothetical protein